MNPLLVLAVIAGRRCAFPALEVQSVIDVGEITPIPRAADCVLGLAALRSQILTVIDCRTAIGFAPSDYGADHGVGHGTDHRAVVVRVDGHLYALKLDLVEDVASAISEPAPLPGGFGPQWDRVARGMVETDLGPILVLDLPALVAQATAPQAAV